ncbi:conserved unknown protein [Ectocarpus siliculosus]|uniref:RanBD1 domain-containing protein n=1 Tax=Ectocarpus siliculosus TaxID=2880 RepID=D8LNF2_ECTSI|nr:conserved unknown protein [Ectocarpus siliculosus]|eukprot:CBN77309.1 conserved unknown protein [Ectocarpus siliculosus]
MAAMATELDKEFGRLLESHRDVPDAAVMTPIKDPSFAVLTCPLDQVLAASMLGVLSTEPQNHKPKNLPFTVVQRKLASAMKLFLATERLAPAARRAVVTASLSVFRHSCAVTVPAKLSGMAAHALLRALVSVTTGTTTSSSAGAAGGSKKHHNNNHRHRSRSPSTGATGGSLVLGTEGFPESQVAAFLLDVTRVEPPPPPTPPVAVPADVALKIISAFGVGKAGRKGEGHSLEWGGPSVADSLRGSVRRVANRLQREGKWGLVSELVEHMETRGGVEECEGVLGMKLGEVNRFVRVLMRQEKTMKVICNHVADPRIVLKPNAGSDRSWVWNAFDFTEGQLEEMTFALRFGNSDSANEFKEVEHMIGLGNLPAAAALMDHFGLHGALPALDPALIEASARERAAAHLQLPISSSRVLVVEGWQTLQYARQVLMEPAAVGGKGTVPGVRCVGLDVENSPTTNRATLLQVATSTDVFLFDLIALLGRAASLEVSRQFDATVEDLLTDPHIVKLGFSFAHDATALRKTFPSARGFRRIAALLEVGELSSAVLGRSTPSLSKTCEAWLGKPLDKTECASKWDVRPLTADQVRYAALDAHCLVGIFEEMLLERGGRLAATPGTRSDGSGNENPHRWWTGRLVANIDGPSSHHSR